MNKKIRFIRNLPVIIGVACSLLIALGVYFLKDMFEKPTQTKKQIQQVTILQPPPPPPPPPPEQKPPEPEVKEEKIEEPEPEPEPEEKAEEPPPGESLGVDAEGAAGSDAFGLQGKKGGAGLIGGGGGSATVWTGQQIAKGVENELKSLLADTEARGKSFQVVLKVWLEADGRLSRAELGNSTGKPAIDDVIKQALRKLRYSLQKPLQEDVPRYYEIDFDSRA